MNLRFAALILSFDWKVRIYGPRVPIAALLDDATRAAVARMVREHRVVYERGAFTLDARAAHSVTGGPLASAMDGRRMARFLRSVVRLGHRLRSRVQIRPRDLLLQNVESDPRTAVRQHNLSLLIDRFPESGETERAVRAALEHHDDGLRLTGAMHFSRRSPPDILPLEGIVWDNRAALEAREVALSRILTLLGPEDMDDVLTRALTDPQLVRRVLSECRRRKRPPPREALAKLLLSAEAGILKDVIRYVAHLGSTWFEPILIQILQTGGEVEKITAARALGEVGTARAAAGLYRVANGILTSPQLRKVALESVDAIRLRWGYEAGALAVLGPSCSGAVSVREPGELAIDPAPSGSPPQS